MATDRVPNRKTLEIASREIPLLQVWSNLPCDLLRSIYSLLSIKDRCVCKSVCKSWNLVPSSLPACKFPCLMIPHEGGWKLFNPIHNQYHGLDFPELIDPSQIRYSNLGWILASSPSKKHLFFFNPLSKQKMDVPPVGDHDSANPLTIISASFSSSPMHSNCYIFCIYSSTTRDRVHCGILPFGQGDKCWSHRSFKNSVAGFRDGAISSPCSPVVADSIVYCMNEYGDMTLINMFPDHFFRRGALQCSQYVPPNDVMEGYLVQVGGEIWGVFVVPPAYPDFDANNGDHDYDGRRAIWVYRLVYSIEDESYLWEPTTDLENKCLYVGEKGSFATEAGDGKGTPNTIYFNCINNKNGEVTSCSYCERTGEELLVVDSHYDPPPPYKASIWIQPYH